MTSPLRRARARLALGSGLAGLALTTSLALAPPAAAQADQSAKAAKPTAQPADAPGKGAKAPTQSAAATDAAAQPTKVAQPATAAVEPAGQLAQPVEQSRFDVGIAALLRILDQVEDNPAVAEGDLASFGDRGCVDAGPAEADVPRMIVEIFTCRLLEAGYTREEARQISAEAVVVAACESEFKKKVVVFDGKYVNQAHPRTGYRYTAAGVFQFIRATADKWIEPDGYARVFAPRRNIDAAARLYMHNRANGLRGWEDWACAAVSDGFAKRSVLPGWPGGPAELPAWAFKLADAA